MKTAIITVAGVSSRFNEGIPETEKTLKAIYWEKERTQTLLYHLMQKCSFADRIIIVGGYRYESLLEYLKQTDSVLKDKITTVYNEHYEDYGSGFSLSLGLKEAFREDVSEILFVEGDLDIDDDSFNSIAVYPGNVLTYNYEPIYANKAVVLYQDDKGKYRYAFNSSHGMLTIQSPFSCILNSGQVWKFTDMQKLKNANRLFLEEDPKGTNLQIIQHYLNQDVTTELIGIKRWTNCNTRRDYQHIVTFW